MSWKLAAGSPWMASISNLPPSSISYTDGSPSYLVSQSRPDIGPHARDVWITTLPEGYLGVSRAPRKRIPSQITRRFEKENGAIHQPPLALLKAGSKLSPSASRTPHPALLPSKASVVSCAIPELDVLEKSRVVHTREAIPGLSLTTWLCVA